MEIYDENVAVKKINDALLADGRKSYDEDELLNVIDMIWDYYEENGLLDIDDDFEADEDENIHAELVDYVIRMLKKDVKAGIDVDDVPLIISVELEYEDSLIDL